MKEYALGEIGTFWSGLLNTEQKLSGGDRTVRAVQPSDVPTQQTGVSEWDLPGALRTINPSQKNLEKSLLRKGDLILKTVGDFNACRVKSIACDAVLVGHLQGIRMNPEFCLSEYFMWYSTTLEFQRQIEQQYTGTTMKRLKPKSLKETKIRIPEIQQQKKIARVYRGLQKIREIENAQSQARAVYSKGLFQKIERSLIQDEARASLKRKI